MPPKASRLAPCPTHSIDLINEDDAGSILTGLGEQVSNLPHAERGQHIKHQHVEDVHQQCTSKVVTSYEGLPPLPCHWLGSPHPPPPSLVSDHLFPSFYMPHTQECLPILTGLLFLAFINCRMQAEVCGKRRLDDLLPTYPLP